MVEHLPPGSPVHRAEAGHDWQDEHGLLWDVDAQLRVLTTQVYNALRGDAPARETEFLPTPFGEQEPEKTPEEAAAEEAEAEEISANLARLWGA